MIDWLRARWRRLTFRRRLRVGGPLHVTFHSDGIYLVTFGEENEIVEARQGDTRSFKKLKGVVKLRSGLGDE